MNKFFTETALLSDSGKELVAKLSQELDNILNSNEISNMSTGELIGLEANIKKLVGDRFSDKLTGK